MHEEDTEIIRSRLSLFDSVMQEAMPEKDTETVTTKFNFLGIDPTPRTGKINSLYALMVEAEKRKQREDLALFQVLEDRYQHLYAAVLEMLATQTDVNTRLLLSEQLHSLLEIYKIALDKKADILKELHN